MFSVIEFCNRVNKADLAALDINLDKDINWQKIFEITLSLTKQKKFKNRDVVLSFVSEKEIKKLNKEFRAKNAVTDVLSFPMDDDEPALAKILPLGDIVICSKRAVQQAKEYRHSQKREFAFLFVHGLLHLLGYDHIEVRDAKKMFALQEKILNQVKILR